MSARLLTLDVVRAVRDWSLSKYGCAKATDSRRFGVMVIEEIAMSTRLDCTALNRPLKGMLTNSTLFPARLATSLTTSTSKPTNSPLEF
ncbi:hypothetical protein D3C84_960800 [compost metagenome]